MASNSGVNLAKAWVTIIPTTEGAEQAITDALAPGVDKAGKQTGKALGGKIAAGLGAAAKGGALAAGAAVVAFGKASIETGQQFEASMSNVAALSGATGEELEMLEATARQFGSTTKFSASEAADALGYMALAGWNTSEMTEGLGGVLDLAAASGMGLAESSDMVTDYLSAFGLEAKDSAHFADMLAYAQANSNTSAAQLGDAYKNCAANLNAAGQDVETTTSLLAMMANQGLKGSEAGTALNAIMRDITASMQDGAIQIGDTSIAVQDADGNYRDLTDILVDVEAATSGMGDAERAAALSAVFTADSTKGLNLILNEGVSEASMFEWGLRSASTTMDGLKTSIDETTGVSGSLDSALQTSGINAEDFATSLDLSGGSAENLMSNLHEMGYSSEQTDALLASLGMTTGDLQTAMDDAEGSAATMAATMGDNLQGDVANMNSAFEETQLKLYNAVSPALRTGAQAVTNTLIPALGDGITAFDNFLNGTENVVPVYDEFGTQIGTTTEKSDGFMSKLADLGEKFAPLGESIGGLAGSLGDTLGPAFEGIGGIVDSFIETLGGIAEPAAGLVDSFAGFLDATAPAAEAAFGTLGEAADLALGGLGTVAETGIGAASGLLDTFTAAANGDWSTAWTTFETTVGGVFTGLGTAAETTFPGLTSTIKGAWDTISSDATTSWETISTGLDTAWSGISTAAETAWTGIQGFIEDPIGSAAEALGLDSETIKSGFETSWSTLSTTAETTWTGIQGFMEDPIGNAATALGLDATTIKSGFETAWSGLSTTADTTWKGIQGFMEDPIGTAATNLGLKSETIKTGLDTAWSGISGIADTTWKSIQGFMEDPIGTAQTTLGTITGDLTTLFDEWGIDDLISGIFSPIEGFMTDPITNAQALIDTAASTISGIITGMDLTLPSIALPHFNVSGGEFPWGIAGEGTPPSFSVDWYAKGGFIADPTLIGVGEAGPEMILPRNGSLMDQFGATVASYVAGAGSTINVVINGNVDSRDTADYLARQTGLEVGRALAYGI